MRREREQTVFPDPASDAFVAACAGRNTSYFSTVKPPEPSDLKPSDLNLQHPDITPCRDVGRPAAAQEGAEGTSQPRDRRGRQGERTGWHQAPYNCRTPPPSYELRDKSITNLTPSPHLMQRCCASCCGARRSRLCVYCPPFCRRER